MITARYLLRRWRASAALLLPPALLALASASASPQFEGVNASSGIVYAGTSWGASWGDLDNDRWPDLWVGNHQHPAIVYQNNRDGTFTKTRIPDDVGDGHGAAWADFDNDGDQDLLQMGGQLGGSIPSPNLLFINNGGVLEEQGASLGLSVADATGATPAWWDWNDDGLLDVLLTNTQSGNVPSLIFEQTASGFVPSSLLPATASGLKYAQLADVTADGELDLIVGQDNLRVIAADGGVLTDITEAIGLPDMNNVRDFAIGDFNGDLRADIFVARADVIGGSAVVQPSPSDAALRLIPVLDGYGVVFSSDGPIAFRVIKTWAPTVIFIGSAGIHPEGGEFTLDPASAATHGLAPFTFGVDRGIYIGYDDLTGSWLVLASQKTQGGSYGAGVYLELLMHGTQPITQLTPIGFLSSNSMARQDLVFFQNDHELFDGTQFAGLANPSSCVSAVTADFDNDMDLDIYVACTGAITNRPNRLFENNGRGQFAVVSAAGGAAGAMSGRSDSVVTADYDQDGFLDLFVTNGEGAFKPLNFGPHQLFHNLGNENHYIEIDLEGVASNRDGLGARVLASAGGVTQVRWQAGGMHNRAQNDRRIHFGLGPNTLLDTLAIYWPSGRIQQLTNIPADQILYVVEPQ